MFLVLIAQVRSAASTVGLDRVIASPPNWCAGINAACVPGTYWDRATCSCKTNNFPSCTCDVQCVHCLPGTHWSVERCMCTKPCEPRNCGIQGQWNHQLCRCEDKDRVIDDICQPRNCGVGGTWDPKECTCIVVDPMPIDDLCQRQNCGIHGSWDAAHCRCVTRPTIGNIVAPTCRPRNCGILGTWDPKSCTCVVRDPIVDDFATQPTRVTRPQPINDKIAAPTHLPCNGISVLCKPGFLWDQPSCSCKPCRPKPCSGVNRWNPSRCRCEPLFLTNSLRAATPDD